MKSNPCLAGDLDLSVLVDDQSAAVSTKQGEPFGRPAEQRSLGEDLCLEGTLGEGGNADEPGPAGFPRRRIEQVMGHRSVGISPGARRDPGRRDPASAEAEEVGFPAGDRVFHEDVKGRAGGLLTANSDIPPAADQVPRVADEQFTRKVGRQALADPPGVKANTGGASDRAGLVVYLERLIQS